MKRIGFTVLRGMLLGAFMTAILALGLDPIPFWSPILLLVSALSVGATDEFYWRRYPLKGNWGAGCRDALIGFVVMVAVVATAWYTAVQTEAG